MKGRLFLALVSLYLLGGYRAALADLGYARAPTYGRSWFWGAQFHMFNEPRPATTN